MYIQKTGKSLWIVIWARFIQEAGPPTDGLFECLYVLQLLMVRTLFKASFQKFCFLDLQIVFLLESCVPETQKSYTELNHCRHFKENTLYQYTCNYSIHPCKKLRFTQKCTVIILQCCKYVALLNAYTCTCIILLLCYMFEWVEFLLHFMQLSLFFF